MRLLVSVMLEKRDGACALFVQKTPDNIRYLKKCSARYGAHTKLAIILAVVSKFSGRKLNRFTGLLRINFENEIF